MLVIWLGASPLCGQADTVAIQHEACFLSIAQLIGTETADRPAEENSEVIVAFQLSEGAGITGYTLYGYRNAAYGEDYLKSTLDSLRRTELTACEINEELIVLPILLQRGNMSFHSLSLSRVASRKIANLRRAYRAVVWPFFLIQDY